MSKETKELQKKNGAELAALVEYAHLMDDLPSADASDYRIPNLVIVQPTSKLQANPGEVVDLNTKQVVCTANKPLNFIPLWFFKTWEIFFEDKQNNRAYQGKELFSPKNAMWKWEEEQTDGKIRRYLNTNVFMILEKDLDSPMPQLYMFRFRGKSTNEGKKLLTFWTNAKNYKQIPFSYVFSVTPTMVTDQKGKYFIASLANAMEGDQYKQISGAQLKVAAGWVEMIMKNLAAMTSAQLAVEDDVSDVVETEAAAPVNHAPLPTEGDALAF